MVIVASLFEKRAAGLYHNTAVVIDADGRYLGKYRKMHIPDDPQYYEKFYFTPGDLGFPAWDTRFGRIGVLVCWDQWYPEGARLTALRGAQILFYPTAIGWLPPEKAEHGAQQQAAWETIQRSHAIANGVYVCAVNRVGHEGEAAGGIEFWGGSFVADPGGRVLAKARRAAKRCSSSTCDLGRWMCAHALAVPARPPHRRVRGHHQALPGLSGERGLVTRAHEHAHRARSPAHHARYRSAIRMPAEWEPHRGTWLSWPHKEASWPGKFEPVPAIFARMVRALADREEVHINVAGPDMEAQVRAPATAGRRRRQRPLPLSSRPTTPGAATTARSSCSASRTGASRRSSIGATTPGAASIRPTTSTTPSPAGSRAELGLPVFHPGIVMEGGSIDVNGRGHAAHHRGVPAQPQPQPAARPAEIEQYLGDYPRRAAHPLARRRHRGRRHRRPRGRPHALRRPDHGRDGGRGRSADANYAPLQENLRAARAACGPGRHAAHVVTLPMPRALDHEGQRLPASYANFYIANGSCCSRPTTRPGRRGRSARSRGSSPAGASSGSTAPTSSGDSAPSIASPSSGRETVKD